MLVGEAWQNENTQGLQRWREIYFQTVKTCYVSAAAEKEQKERR